MNTDFFTVFQDFTILSIIKIPLLILIALYAVFAVILLNKTRSLGRLIFLKASIATLLLNTLAFLHLLSSLLLFLLTLVIL